MAQEITLGRTNHILLSHGTDTMCVWLDAGDDETLLFNLESDQVAEFAYKMLLEAGVRPKQHYTAITGTAEHLETITKSLHHYVEENSVEARKQREAAAMLKIDRDNMTRHLTSGNGAPPVYEYDKASKETKKAVQLILNLKKELEDKND